MDARPKTVRDILHTGDQYIIPLFQRYYSWTKEHWDRLRKDIWALMEDEAKAVHFLGPLVCTPTSHYPGNIPAYQLIDGQQRLTTLTILLASVRDVALVRGLKDLAEEVSEDYLLHKRKQGIERYKVLPRLGDREALTAIVEAQDLKPHATQQVFRAWKYFHRYVGHLAREETENQLRKLLDTVSRRLSLVVVTIEGENPYEIFESLNSTGLPLEEADLIRNFVFMQIPLAKQQEFFDQQWKELEELFDATDAEPKVPMTPFYRDYLMKDGQYSREDATFIDFKKHHKDRNLTPDQQVEELKHYAKLEMMLRRPKSVAKENLRRSLCQIDGMDITTAYPLVLNLLDRNQRGQLDDSELLGCLQDLVSFVLRRSICGETTRTYGRWFAEAVTAIHDNPRQDLATYWTNRRWPDDQALRERLVDFPLYWRESRKAKVILEALEERFGHKEKVPLDKLSIEHVMPQTISGGAAGKSWKAMLGDDWEAVHEKYVHSLGNLTLTGYNPDLSNSGFEKKRELLKDSHLELNRYFDNNTAWNADSIRKRARDLADAVVQLWPRPRSGVQYSASAEAQPEPDGLSGTEKKYLEYWRQLDVRLEERGVAPEVITPTTRSFLNVNLGATRSMILQLGIWKQKDLYVTLYPTSDTGEFIFERLLRERNTLESEMGYQLVWDGGDAEVYIKDEDVAWSDREDWHVQHDWFGDRFEDFMRVFKLRVEQCEQEAMRDPELRRKIDQRDQLIAYWEDCGKALGDSGVAFREDEPGHGRKYCRFEKIETGISFGAQVYPNDSMLCVYFGVGGSASRKLRSRYRELRENEAAEMESQIGEKLEWEDSYVSASVSMSLEDRSDWPRQHKWIRVTAEKFLKVFTTQLPIEG